MFDAIICDESAKIANPRTKTYKALNKLKAKHRFALNGTPILNRPEDIWAQINWVAPGALGNYFDFVSRYCLRNHFNAIIGYQNMDELAERVNRHMIRRLKEDVLTELPEKIITDVPFVLSEKEKEMSK